MSKNKNMHAIAAKVFPLLPGTYALVSTLFWVLTLCTDRINFVSEKIASVASSSFIIAYSFSALLFWLPYFREKISMSFLHSLLIFLLPFLNMLFKTYRHRVIAHDYLLNVFRIYTAGFIIYLIAIVFVCGIKWLLLKLISQKHNQKSQSFISNTH
jgi:hypothetical protein